MSFKKQMLAIAAVGALSAATAVPAMALENEFHGMFKAFGFTGNAYNGGNSGGAPGSGSMINLAHDARTNTYAEQRARLQYIAKANDNLKLITHFELDTRFGGAQYNAASKYDVTGDAGQLDADSVMIETKNVYLDFNEPFTKTNVKVGVQPWADSYGTTFALFDGAGIQVSRKFGNLTPTFAWFRVNDATPNDQPVINKKNTDVIVTDLKYAVNKDLTVGASYYGVLNDAGTAAADKADGGSNFAFKELHMIGLNASAKFGPAAVNAFAAYELGEYAYKSKLNAYEFGATGKVKAGPGNVNLAFLYLSGDSNGTGAGNQQQGWQSLSPNTTYFAPANMWLMIRSPQGTNTSEGIGGNNLNKGGRGFMGFFGGYEYSAGKFFANANAGAAFVPNTGKNNGVEEDNYIGTEANAQVGYKVYDNLSVSLVGAYMFLGDAITSPTKKLSIGVDNADDPYLGAVQFAYVF